MRLWECRTPEALGMPHACSSGNAARLRLWEHPMTKDKTGANPTVLLGSAPQSLNCNNSPHAGGVASRPLAAAEESWRPGRFYCLGKVFYPSRCGGLPASPPQAALPGNQVRGLRRARCGGGAGRMPGIAPPWAAGYGGFAEASIRAPPNFRSQALVLASTCFCAAGATWT